LKGGAPAITFKKKNFSQTPEATDENSDTRPKSDLTTTKERERCLSNNYSNAPIEPKKNHSRDK